MQPSCGQVKIVQYIYMFGRVPLWLCEDITACCYMYCYFRNKGEPVRFPDVGGRLGGSVPPDRSIGRPGSLPDGYVPRETGGPAPTPSAQHSSGCFAGSRRPSVEYVTSSWGLRWMAAVGGELTLDRWWRRGNVGGGAAEAENGHTSPVVVPGGGYPSGSPV